MIALGVIEDNEVISRTLRDFFREDPEIRITSMASHVDEFYQQEGEQPQVLLLDLMLPYRNGMDCITEICSRYPGVSIIIHSVADDQESIFKCLCHGAQSYLTKGETLDRIRETILLTHGGGSLMSVEIARKVVDFFGTRAASVTAQVQPEDMGLNPREQWVVNLILDGLSYKMVASEMGVSINTVRKHIKSVYRKLNINTSMELARLYHRQR
ncbi:MAG: response regulator transcription factor [Chitinophagaceae bacterium]|jgi:DNA-binding NarL/FixJ family response regulator|nr:response regulator transcription factor [Chitinophagaceae bacterium]